MEPDLEVVDIRGNESFKVWSHGYPFRTVRWHFHPEYEIHLVTATTGRFLVGDFIGAFAPGNLVMTGPNLPHNWVSDVPAGVTVSDRCLVVQFTPGFIDRVVDVFPELDPVRALLDESRRGILFSAAASAAAGPGIRALLSVAGPRRIGLFIDVLGHLAADAAREHLAGESYIPDPSGYMSAGMNRVIAHIRENLRSGLREADVAAIAGRTASAFSRSFKRHTGMSFVSYVNRLRISHACQLLMSDEVPITDICYEVGFNNLSNFNRQFLVQKKLPPSKFRALHRLQAAQSAPEAA